MLKISSPFKEKTEVISLIDAGADELYCGYLPAEWKEKFTDLEFERKGGGSNFTDLKELGSAVNLAHKKNTPVYLALNGLYVNNQYPLLLKIIDQVETIDFDAFIVADIGLLLTLKERGTKKKIHISTGGTVFNSQAVNFYRSLNASRIVLDRQTTLESIKAISGRARDMEFEVFILNTLCVYIDGLCTFMHNYKPEEQEYVRYGKREKDKEIKIVTTYDYETVGDACCLKYSIQTYDARLKRLYKSTVKPAFFKHFIDNTECGVCAMHFINRTKVSSIKIVGRQSSSENRLKSVRLVRSCLDILKYNKKIGEQEYIKHAQEIYRTNFKYKKECEGNNCYHPGVLL